MSSSSTTSSSTHSPSLRDEIQKYHQIKLLDSDPDNNIDLYCYDHCCPDDPEVVKACRGVVFSNEKIVLQGFPYTYEFTQEKNKDQIDELFSSSSSLKFFDAYEGTLIRIFCFNNKWYLSTNKKLDAFKSRWGSKTCYGDYFINALQYESKVSTSFRERLGLEGDQEQEASVILDRLFNTLDPLKQYMFFIINDFNNRLVCEYDHPKVFHVGTFHDGNLSLEREKGFDSPKEHSFQSPAELFSYVNNTIDYKLLQGIIIFAEENKQYKIYNKDYLDWYQVRGNEASIKFRYIQLRNDPRKKKLLLQLYPHFEETFKDLESTVTEICHNILQAYINRYIRKQYVVLPVEQFIVMSEVHKWFLEDKDHHRVNINIVIKTFNNQNAPTINRMIKKFVYEKKKSLIVPEIEIPEACSTTVEASSSTTNATVDDAENEENEENEDDVVTF